MFLCLALTQPITNTPVFVNPYQVVMYRPAEVGRGTFIHLSGIGEPLWVNESHDEVDRKMLDTYSQALQDKIGEGYDALHAHLEEVLEEAIEPVVRALNKVSLVIAQKGEAVLV